MNTQEIPQEITEAYYPGQRLAIEALGGGIINATFLVETDKANRAIIQRLHPIIDPIQTEDYQYISEHLVSDGWQIPRLIPTAQDTLYATDESGAYWRATEYIESDTPPDHSSISPTLYGLILGRLHRTLSQLDYQPRFQLPHYHDTAHYCNELVESLPYIKHAEAQQLARLLLVGEAILPSSIEIAPQLIHADPKIANILVRDNEPFTFIDWDTTMHASIWIDIGDMVRSYMNQNEAMGLHPIAGVSELIEGYRSQNFPDYDAEEFFLESTNATLRIIVELAMRYLADYKDGNQGYFSWDETKYPTRHAHNIQRVQNCMSKMKLLMQHSLQLTPPVHL